MNPLRFIVITAILLWSCNVEVGRASGHGAGSLGLSRDEALLYAADTDNDLLIVFDAQTLEKRAEVKTGHGPARVAVAPDDTVFVSNRNGASVTMVHRGAWDAPTQLATAPGT